MRERQKTWSKSTVVLASGGQGNRRSASVIKFLTANETMRACDTARLIFTLMFGEA